jgi:hypothetical protein
MKSPVEKRLCMMVFEAAFMNAIAWARQCSLQPILLGRLCTAEISLMAAAAAALLEASSADF